MNWSELTQNWADTFVRIKTRFPHLDDGSMPFLKLCRDRFESHLADTHHLTRDEAREEFESFLYIEMLAKRRRKGKTG